MREIFQPVDGTTVSATHFFQLAFVRVLKACKYGSRKGDANR